MLQEVAEERRSSVLSRRLLPSLPPVTNEQNSSALTVQVVSAGVEISGSPQVGERWLRILGTREGVHLDCGDTPGSSSHHDLVLKLNTRSSSVRVPEAEKRTM